MLGAPHIVGGSYGANAAWGPSVGGPDLVGCMYRKLIGVNVNLTSVMHN